MERVPTGMGPSVHTLPLQVLVVILAGNENPKEAAIQYSQTPEIKSLSHAQTQARWVELGILRRLLPHCISEVIVLGLEGSPLLHHHRTILLVFLYLSSSTGQ